MGLWRLLKTKSAVWAGGLGPEELIVQIKSEAVYTNWKD